MDPRFRRDDRRPVVRVPKKLPQLREFLFWLTCPGSQSQQKVVGVEEAEASVDYCKPDCRPCPGPSCLAGLVRDLS
jgi:hypothetical protein